MKKNYLVLILLFIITPVFSQVFEKSGAGVTIITHGWNPDEEQPVWMDSLANAILSRTQGIGAIGKITVTGSAGNLTATCSDWDFNLTTTTSGEIVILLDWTAVADHLTTSVTAQEVAAAVVPKIYQSQEGQPALSELPIHLIGHSRGGGMVFEIGRLLGLQGLEVEEITALDPHPLTEDDPQPLLGSSVIDTPCNVYENVLFAEVFYQDIEYPEGEYVTGAFNRLWTNLPGGYHNESGYTYTIGTSTYDFSDHMNIILMYHGTTDTISTAAVYNGEATMAEEERGWFNTFEDKGKNEGFVYSRINGGDRKSSAEPVEGADKIINGYNSVLGGNGTRSVLDWTNAVWPNVITHSLYRDNSVLSPGSLSVSQRETISVNYKYRSYAYNSTVSLIIDTDRNPYNDNDVETVEIQNHTATGSSINEASITWEVGNLYPDTSYYAYLKISANNYKRYSYLPYKITVTSVSQLSITQHPQSLTDVCPGATVEYAVQGDDISFYQWQLSTDSGNIWTDITDNVTYSGSDTAFLSVIVSPDIDNYQYRCVVSNDMESLTSEPASLSVDKISPVPDENTLPDIVSECEITGLTPPMATDNCSGSITATTDTEFPINAPGTTMVIWTYEDDNGNITTQTQNVIYTPIDDSVTQNDNVLTANATGDYAYQWGKCVNGDFIPLNGETESSLTVGATGDYAVKIDNGNCTVTSDCFHVTVTDVSVFEMQGLKIYPNPLTDIFNIELQDYSNATVKIYDMSGKMVLSKDLWQKHTPVDIHNLSRGIYLLQVKKANEIYNGKIIRE